MRTCVQLAGTAGLVAAAHRQGFSTATGPGCWLACVRACGRRSDSGGAAVNSARLATCRHDGHRCRPTLLTEIRYGTAGIDVSCACTARQVTGSAGLTSNEGHIVCGPRFQKISPEDPYWFWIP